MHILQLVICCSQSVTDSGNVSLVNCSAIDNSFSKEFQNPVLTLFIYVGFDIFVS